MLYLTSSVASVAKHLHKNYLEKHNYHSVLFIDTAAEPEIADGGGDSWLIADLKSLEEVGFDVKRYSITDQSAAEIESEMNSHDILYMCGGNTAYLLEKLRKTDGFQLVEEWVKAGKPYVGTSAGSIITGPRLPDYFYNELPEAEDPICFGFVNFTLVPHWGSEHFKEVYLSERLQRVYTERQDPLLLLTDTQYVVANLDGSFTIETT